MNNKSFIFELEQMITKGLIDQKYKILVTEGPQINRNPSQNKISFAIVGRNTNKKT